MRNRSYQFLTRIQPEVEKIVGINQNDFQRNLSIISKILTIRRRFIWSYMFIICLGYQLQTSKKLVTHLKKIKIRWYSAETLIEADYSSCKFTFPRPTLQISLSLVEGALPSTWMQIKQDMLSKSHLHFKWETIKISRTVHLPRHQYFTYWKQWQRSYKEEVKFCQ